MKLRKISKYLYLFLAVGWLTLNSCLMYMPSFAAETADFQSPVNVLNQDLDVIFCIDHSGSVWSQAEIRDQAARALANLAVNRNVSVGCVYFADHVYTEKVTNLTEITSDTDLNSILSLSAEDENNKSTNIGTGFEKAHEMFEHQSKNGKRIVVLFSDGINESQDSDDIAYKESADKNTQKWAEKLQEDGAEIYCVYLKKRSDRSDVEFMKKIVNYFDDSLNYDNRYLEIKESDIDSLCDQFVQVFYNAQNNMAYSKFDCDSSGSFPFYVPDTNVKQVQVFLKNVKPGSQLKFTCDGNEVVPASDREDGSLRFVVFEQPATGKWKLEAVSDGDPVSGTLAYYADVQAAVRIVPEGEGIKGQQACLQADFADQDGNKLKTLDPSASITAVVTLDGKELWSGRLQNQDGVCRSESFELSRYGSSEISFTIEYESFLNLQFEMPGLTVVPREPLAKDMGSRFACVKQTKGGKTIYRYTFDKSDLFEDPEQGNLYLSGYRNRNESNPTIVLEEGDKLIICSDKADAIEVDITVQDDTGKLCTATVKGAMEVVRSLTGTIICAVIGIFVLIAVIIILKQKEEKAKQIPRGRLNRQAAEYEKIVRDYRANDSLCKQVKAKYVGEEFCRVQKELAEQCRNLLPAQLKDIGAEDMVDPVTGLAPNERVRSCLEAYQTACNELADYEGRLPGRGLTAPTINELKKQSVKELELLADEREEQLAEIRKLSSAAENAAKACISALNEALQTKRSMERRLSMAERLQGGTFRCVINYQYFYQEKDEWKSHNGAKVLTAEKTGYVSLDDLILLTGSSYTLLRNITGIDSNVVIYPSDPDKGEGIVLRSLSNFIYREAAEQSWRPESRTALMLKGYRYKVYLPSIGRLNISVE